MERFDDAIDWAAIKPEFEDDYDNYEAEAVDIDSLNEGKMLLENSKSGDSDWHKAIKCLEDAAEYGVAEAMYLLGTELLKQAVNSGVANYQESYNDDLRRMFAKGVNWLNSAAELNSIDALEELAYLYDSGEINGGRNSEWDDASESENLEEAIKLYEKAHEIKPNEQYLIAIDRIEKELEFLSNQKE